VKSLVNAGIEPGFIGRPSRILVTVPTEGSFIIINYEVWNFNSGNYLFTTDTK